MNDTPQQQPVDSGTVRYLRLLVTVLTVTMVVGFIIIVVLFVIRFSDAFGSDAADTFALPVGITLPEGTSATAFTQGKLWYAIVTDDDRILIFDRQSGALRQSIDLQ